MSDVCDIRVVLRCWQPHRRQGGAKAGKVPSVFCWLVCPMSVWAACEAEIRSRPLNWDILPPVLVRVLYEGLGDDPCGLAAVLVGLGGCLNGRVLVADGPVRARASLPVAELRVYDDGQHKPCDIVAAALADAGSRCGRPNCGVTDFEWDSLPAVLEVCPSFRPFAKTFDFSMYICTYRRPVVAVHCSTATHWPPVCVGKAPTAKALLRRPLWAAGRCAGPARDVFHRELRLSLV